MSFSRARIAGSAERLTLASLLAMAVATAFAVQNPWWAAMAVWMIGQQRPGLLLERSIAQLLGTLLGAAAGLVLLKSTPGNPTAALFGLTILVAACCGLANVMRHQRAYGAALCGLTASVIVVLTLGTNIDPVSFAAARALDNVIGIGATLLVSWLFDRAAAAPDLAARARTVAAEALALVEASLAQTQALPERQEGTFLLDLAALEASAEDMAAGSVQQRRRLQSIETLFASLLDLLIIARAIRTHANARRTAEESPALQALRVTISAAAARLSVGGPLGTADVELASRALERADPLLAPPLQEMRARFAQAAEHFQRVTVPEPTHARRWSARHPDAVAIRLAIVRSLLVVGTSVGAWLLLGHEAMRYLALGAAIFTVLFAAADEPAPAVWQVLLGSGAASAAALLWRLAVMPTVANGWLSLGLAIPIVYGAAHLQLRRGSAFTGLAFNMIFAVFARPVDVTPGDPQAILAAEVALLVGIGASYGAYRWLVPMNADRRRNDLRSAIRREVAAIANGAGTRRAEDSMARLRHLVFRLAIQARGQVRHAEDALAALTLGHVALRLGEALADAATTGPTRRPIQESLKILGSPLHDPAEASAVLRDYGNVISRLSQTGEQSWAAPASSVAWLMHLAAREFALHQAFFAPRAGSKA